MKSVFDVRNGDAYSRDGYIVPGTAYTVHHENGSLVVREPGNPLCVREVEIREFVCEWRLTHVGLTAGCLREIGRLLGGRGV